MPTVRCPTCRRALHLPESHPGGDARCPLCQTTFPTTAETAPETAPIGPRATPGWSGGRQPARTPTPIPIPASQPRADTKGTSPFDFEEPDEGEVLSRPDREALRRAAGWLKAHAGIGLIHMFTCGCVNVLAFGALTGVGGERYLAGAAIDVLVRLVVLGVIAAGAESLQRRRNRALATTAAILALLMGTYLLLVPAIIFLALAGVISKSAGISDDAVVPACISLAMTVLVALLGLVGGVRSLVLLNKPDVLRAFQETPRKKR